MNNNNSEDIGFFNWFTGLFKKPQPVVYQPTKEELEEEAKRIQIKSKYRLEYLQSLNLYFVQYSFKEEWWYLRRWNDDYTFERVRGNAIRITDPIYLDEVIKFHQDWINEGHVFLSFGERQSINY